MVLSLVVLSLVFATVTQLELDTEPQVGKTIHLKVERVCPGDELVITTTFADTSIERTDILLIREEPTYQKIGDAETDYKGEAVYQMVADGKYKIIATKAGYPPKYAYFNYEVCEEVVPAEEISDEEVQPVQEEPAEVEEPALEVEEMPEEPKQVEIIKEETVVEAEIAEEMPVQDNTLLIVGGSIAVIIILMIGYFLVIKRD